MQSAEFETDRQTERGGAPVDGAGDSRIEPAGQSPVEGLKSAIVGAVLAPFRVHRYRDVHSRMLRDALYTLDCGPRSDDSDRCE